MGKYEWYEYSECANFTNIESAQIRDNPTFRVGLSWWRCPVWSGVRKILITTELQAYLTGKLRMISNWWASNWRCGDWCAYSDLAAQSNYKLRPSWRWHTLCRHWGETGACPVTRKRKQEQQSWQRELQQLIALYKLHWHVFGVEIY